jgi:hypothetical protein
MSLLARFVAILSAVTGGLATAVLDDLSSA